MEAIELGRLLNGDAEPTVERARWRDRRRPAGERYLVLPSRSRPRLLVPAGERRAAAAAAAAAHHAFAWRSRLRQWATRAGLTAGLGDLLFRDRLALTGSSTLAGWLSEVMDQPVRLGLRLGPPRANQKPVLALLDRECTVVGYAKLGVTPLTRRLLATERTALTELATAELATVRVPRLRYAGDWHGADLVVVSALPVAQAAAGAGRRGAGLILAAAAELARLRPVVVADLAGSDYHHRLAAQVAALPADPHRELLAATLARTVAADRRLEFGCWHGDFFAGNLAVTGSQVLVWDWERFATGVPVGFDALHHTFMSELLVRGRALPEAAARMAERAAEVLAPLAVPAAQAPVVAALYLVEIATRYRTDSNQAGGGGLLAAAQWLPRALSRLALPPPAEVDSGSE
ncbi:hypothetical protein JQS43_06115 [Natronosporangium hydrolyticum]|uniref:Uncharacterized protein n=1 Tax=Natronosporangium hydrolyticum TaxID=2811111 RepID=A0A895YIT7_9ACTN|nr:hypothetical protein [Natronosporangium hydrolyticum]QSB15905.1 hypothetical protein JQS43_06115 [Natronosporangium hydrolyticum]